MAERLQKVISQAGVASRREAEKLILEGKVRVNGKVVTTLGTKVEDRDRVSVDGKRLRSERPVYVLLNKPRGVVTTLHDPEGRHTVADLVKEIPERIYPVGRLDYHTEGLLVLTNDGALANALMHPRHHVPKVYEAVVLGLVPEEKLDQLRTGIELEDGKTLPAEIYVLGKDLEKKQTHVQITLHEGKNRQIRRMFEAIGHPVRNLKRIKMAFLNLQGLGRGRYRLLTEEEVQQLKQLVCLEES